MEFLKDCILINSYNTGIIKLIEVTYIFIRKITPKKVIKKHNVYEITYLDPVFILSGFEVTTENNLVKTIKVFGYHPNRDPDTHLYCLPDYKRNKIFDQKFFELIVNNIETYYLDSCFFTPLTNQLRYKKLDSIYVQFNKGE